MSRRSGTGFIDRVWDGGAVAFGIVAFLILGLCFPTLRGMVGEMYASFNYSQNMLFPAVAAGLIYFNKTKFEKLTREKDWLGAILCAAGVAVCALAQESEKFVTARYAMMAAITGAGVWFYGRRMVAAAWGPVLLLFLTVPLHEGMKNEIIVPFMAWDQEATASMSATISNMLGARVWRDGYDLHLISGKLNVGLTCTGIGYVASLMAITVAIMYLGKRRKLAANIALLALAPAAGLGANVARVTANLLVCDRYGVAAGMRFFHDAGGNLFALAALAELGVAVWVVDNLFGHRENEPAADVWNTDAKTRPAENAEEK